MRQSKKCACAGKSVAEKFALFKSQLEGLIKGTPKRRSELLKKGSPCFVKLLCEVALNILKGNIVLPLSEYEELKPYKELILLLCEKNVSLEKKQKLLARKLGAFLPKILPGILRVISS